MATPESYPAEARVLREPSPEPGDGFKAARDQYRTQLLAAFRAASSLERVAQLRLQIKEERELGVHAAQAVYEYILKCRSADDFKPEEVNAILRKISANRPNLRIQPLFDAAAQELIQANALVKRARAEYGKPEDLIWAGYDVVLVGKAEASYGPISIHIRFSDNIDYDKVFSATPDNNEQQARNYILEAQGSKACALDWCAIPYLHNKITIEKLEKNHPPNSKGRSIAENFQIHEQAHQLNALIPGWQISEPRLDLPWEVFRIGIEKGKDYFSENQKKLIERFAVECRKESEYDQYAADDVLAFYSEGYTAAEIYEELSEAGGTHDFRLFGNFPEVMDDISQRIRKNFLEAADELRLNTLQPSNPEAVVQKVFWEEYLKTVSSWLKAVQDLEQKRFSREKILALLSTTPLDQWSFLGKLSASKKL